MSQELEDILGAYVCGDVTPAEQAAIEKLIARNPAIKARIAELRECAELLKQGNLALTPALNERLRQQVSGHVPSSRPVSRVITIPPNPWPRRILYAGGLAAAVVLLLVFIGLKKAGAPKHAPQSELARHGETKEPSVAETEKKNMPEVRPVPGTLANVASSSQPPPMAVKEPAVVASVVPPAPDAGQNIESISAPPQQVAGAQPAIKPPAPPVTEPAAGLPVIESAAPEKPEKPAASGEKRDPGSSGQTASVRPGVATPAVSGGDAGAVALAPAVKPNDQPSSNVRMENSSGSSAIQTRPRNDQIAPLAGSAVVGATRDGSIQVTSPDGTVATLQLRDVISSGAQIVTGHGRIALVLPGGGRLWLNHDTSAKLTLKGLNLSITMTAGEISYRGPAGGTLSLAASNLIVSGAHSVDVLLQDKTLIAAVLDKTASVGTKGKTVGIGAGFQAVASLDGTDAPRKEPVGIPLTWWQDLVLPGEGGSDTGKAITTEPAGKKAPKGSKPRGSGR